MELELKLFRVFAHETLKLVLKSNGVELDHFIDEHGIEIAPVKNNIFWHAVYHYRESHQKGLILLQESYKYPIYSDEICTANYLKFCIQQVAKGDTILMDLLRLFALYANFILSLGSCNHEVRERTISYVVENYKEIYNYGSIADVLKTAGSYNFLSEVASLFLFLNIDKEPLNVRITKQLADHLACNNASLDLNKLEGLASRLVAFAKSEYSRIEDAPMEISNGSESNVDIIVKTTQSSNHENLLSTSGIVSSSSSHIDGEKSEDKFEEGSDKSGECSSGSKKTSSVMEISVGDKSHHKRSSTDEDNNSSKKMCTRTTFSVETFEKTEIRDGHEFRKPKNTEKITIDAYIPDSITDDQKAYLDETLEKIRKYNIDNNQVDSDSKINRESSEGKQLIITGDHNASITDPGDFAKSTDVHDANKELHEKHQQTKIEEHSRSITDTDDSAKHSEGHGVDKKYEKRHLIETISNTDTADFSKSCKDHRKSENAQVGPNRSDESEAVGAASTKSDESETVGAVPTESDECEIVGAISTKSNESETAGAMSTKMKIDSDGYRMHSEKSETKVSKPRFTIKNVDWHLILSGKPKTQNKSIKIRKELEPMDTGSNSSTHPESAKSEQAEIGKSDSIGNQETRMSSD